MADFTSSKSNFGGVSPGNATEVTWGGVEPLVSPEQVRNRHLFGVSLVSAMKDPISGRNQVYTDDLIRDNIDRAISTIEEETKLTIFPTQFAEKLPFDRHDYEAFGYFRTEHRPIANVQKFTITPSNEMDIYTVPIDWIEAGNFPKGQINIIPLVSAIGYSAPAAVSAGGAVFLTVLGSQSWIPAFWKCTYVAGFPDGMMPKVINELIGIQAAMDVLSALAATYSRSTSHSLGIDGASQSVSTPGPQLFTTRIADLEKKKARLVRSVKTKFGLNLFSSQV